MRKALATTIAALIGGLTIASAQAAFTGNLGATSNYLWRGVTQTSDAAAVQGGLDYAHDSGLYVGTWASNVDFGDGTSYEADGYIGFSGALGDFGYNLSYTYYAYPDGDDLDFSEALVSVSYKVVKFGAAAAVTNQGGMALDEESGEMAPYGAQAYEGSYYLFADLAFPLKEGLTLGFHVGSYAFDEDKGGSDYVDYNASLTKTTSVGDVSFLVTDTDIDEDDVAVALSWKTTFDL